MNDAVLTARGQGLSGCRTCGRVSPAASRACPRCGAELHQRIPHSIQRVLALLLMGFICYLLLVPKIKVSPADSAQPAVAATAPDMVEERP